MAANKLLLSFTARHEIGLRVVLSKLARTIVERSAEMAADRKLGLDVPLRQEEHSFRTGSKDRDEIVVRGRQESRSSISN